MNPIYSLIELRQSHHYYHHFSTIMVLLVYGYLVYFIATTLTITFLYLLSCKAISHTRIVALVLFPRWCKCLVCVELYQRLIELERIFILPLASHWATLLLIEKATHDPLYLWDITLPPINSLRLENPKETNTFPWNILQATTVIVPRSGGPEALPDTLPERGIITGGLLHRHASLQSDARVVYLGLWVYSSS
jgi:hypothetical protein